MLCGAFVHIFQFGEIAWRANLFSALCTSGAVVFLYAALRAMGIGRWAAAAAALGWVWSRWCWTQSVITEVYGLNSLLTAGVLWSAVAWHRSRKAGPLLAASVLMGLGMSNHHLIALSGLALVGDASHSAALGPLAKSDNPYLAISAAHTILELAGSQP